MSPNQTDAPEGREIVQTDVPEGKERVRTGAPEGREVVRTDVSPSQTYLLEGREREGVGGFGEGEECIFGVSVMSDV